MIDGKFPDYQKVVPKENTKTLTVSSKDFINSVERVASVSIDRKEGVKLEQQYLIGENGLELMSHHPLERIK